ncbi:MAG: class II D-tagatose-bisphosphate aldolase, non-catalytic subunit [Paracoccaceae bacterium]|nr:class II D-tagatose-bisphosphate aldolase, non-catalytic subunit [Paracoccaceae bacterium]MDG1736605.1 class II D-tagatose-bisphosphate aldolase, non-catalytic subunit [Paracoccaceae bacterium]MDG2257318.1 class II D-tagatose-bisphosphate aldolase, non-catalytic subunit [Paracoccaceae bacterium]
MSEVLRDIVSRNRAGECVAIPSICSAQPDVLRASMKWAERLDRPIVVEATSNQVNQDGGYTGKTPVDFVDDINAMASECNVERELITLGGDHLGPQAWRHLSADAAMEKARVLVDAYVAAGFEKIHLDCSEGCMGEDPQLPDAITAARTAELARVCEDAAPEKSIIYVIGTEVPPPGGARVDESGDIPATSPGAALATLGAHEEAFAKLDLGDLKPRIAGLVVQPGVEFSPMHVHHMPLDRDPGLRDVMMGWPGLCLEAHSTDYQHPAVFPRLAELGFAFQKVGPALTFAYRQALYALDSALRISGQNVGLMTTMENLMVSEPHYWQGHYAQENQVARHVGLADRIRYYWPHSVAQKAVANLRNAAEAQKLADPLLWQVFAPEVLERAEGLGGSQVQRLIDAQIEVALDPYDIREKEKHHG